MSPVVQRRERGGVVSFVGANGFVLGGRALDGEMDQSPTALALSDGELRTSLTRSGGKG